MQFMPGTWGSMGVDGDGDGRADIHNDADSIHSAANYLTKSGVTAGAAGVRRALLAYNPVDWYVNDVLYYASRYGGGAVPGDPNDCGPGTATPSCRHLATNASPNSSPGRKATTATPIGWGRPGQPPGTALASPKPPTPRSASRCPAPPRATQLAGRRQRHPHPTRPRETRRPDLLGLLPRTQPDRARHDHLEPGQQNHHRSTQHPCRRRTLQLRQRLKPPHLRNLARRQ